MKNKLLLTLFILLIIISSSFAAEGIRPNIMGKYRQAKASFDEANQSNMGTYAKDILDNANRNLIKASESIETKKEKATLEALEVAILQIELAKIKTEELIASEKTAVTRNRVDKLSHRLDEILTGKGDAK